MEAGSSLFLSSKPPHCDITSQRGLQLAETDGRSSCPFCQQDQSTDPTEILGIPLKLVFSENSFLSRHTARAQREGGSNTWLGTGQDHPF